MVFVILMRTEIKVETSILVRGAFRGKRNICSNWFFATISMCSMAFSGEISAAVCLTCTDLGVDTITLLVLSPDFRKKHHQQKPRNLKEKQRHYDLAAVSKIWLQLWQTEIEGNENNIAAAGKMSARSEERAQSSAPLP